MWCIPRLTPQFREQMEDVLDLYTKPLPPGHELHCFDECPKQLLGTPRGTVACAPGHARRLDYEYERRGTRNLFIAVSPFAGTRTVAVTTRRTAADTAAFLWQYCMDEHRSTRHLHLILDNLNTHQERALRNVWGTRRANAFFSKVTLHFTPSHASWLNMAEIEISCLKTQGLNQRVATEQDLRQCADEITAWRNRHQRTICWRFTKKEAREVFPSLYRVKN